MAGAYQRPCPPQIPFKKSWEGAKIFFWTVHGVIFKGEDYIMNYIDA
jgi:hypothetical protein